MRNRIQVWFGCGLLTLGLIATPLSPAAAQTSVVNTQLLWQLQSLLAQLANLQAELRAQAVSARPDQSTLRTSRFYDGAYIAVYETRGTALTSTATIPSEHSDIWELFTTIAGRVAIRTYISEVRFYDDPNARYDAFTEQIGTTDDWIVGINLAAIDLTDKLLTDSTIELFVHEYAHILHHYNYTAGQQFVETFWRPAASAASTYVSDYAMQNSEEDFAESFTFFVLTPRPDSLDRGRNKVRFFSEQDYFRDVRTAILTRIADAGW